MIHKSLSVNALVPRSRLVHLGQLGQHERPWHRLRIRRLKKQLVAHYRAHGKSGYILLIDFSNYFASIAHDPLKEIVRAALDDERIVALTHGFIDACGDVGLGLGSEPNQICAVAFPSSIDHYVTEMLGVEATGAT